MPAPTVTGFSGDENLGGNKKGLNSKNNSTSHVTITGTNLSDSGMTVYVTNNAGVSWSGDLKLDGDKWKANLKCTNDSTGVGDTEDVTVTVTGAGGNSPGYDTNVDVGSV